MPYISDDARPSNVVVVESSVVVVDNAAGAGGGSGGGRLARASTRSGNDRGVGGPGAGAPRMSTALSGQPSVESSATMLVEAGSDGQQQASDARATPSNGNAMTPSAATAVLERADKKAPAFCDAVRRFLRQHTAALVAAQRARVAAAAGGVGGKKGKKKRGGSKDEGGNKKKKKEPPLEFEPWVNFLEELQRKCNSGAFKIADFQLYAAHLAPHELRNLNAACVTVAKNTFPDNFDEKLAVLRETVRMAAAGVLHRQPSGEGDELFGEAEGGLGPEGGGGWFAHVALDDR